MSLSRGSIIVLRSYSVPDQLYEMYSKGLLDDGENAEDFSEWAGHYRLKQKRQAALEQISKQRLETLRRQADQWRFPNGY